MPAIVLDGQPVSFVQTQDQGDKPVVLFLHGAGGSAAVWPALLTHQPEFCGIVVDLPGHGQSAPPGRRAIDHYAAFVERLARTLKLPRVVLAGHSMGSAIALTVAQRAQIDVQGLFLLGAAARMPVAEAILNGALSDLDGVATWIAEHALAEATPAQRAAVRQGLLATGNLTTFGDFLACNRFDIRQGAGLIDVPAIVVSGTLDNMTPPRFSETLAATLPNGRLVTLEGCGHFSMIERLETVTLLLSGFLSRLTHDREE